MTDFDNACVQAAGSFLQTVVLLDDRASFDLADEEASDEADAEDGDPLVDPDDPNAAPEPAAEAAPPKVLGRAEDKSLNAGLITRKFAAKGLVCAVLRPDDNASLEQETLKAASRADIVVLDWEMGDRGEKATKIVKHIYEADRKAGGRLRLIAIYTGHSPLANVYGSLRAGLDKFDAPEGMKAKDLTLEASDKYARIVMLAKSGTDAPRGERSCVVAEEELPSRLIKEFAKFAGGLLPNATLASIAALRSHTHRMLARLDKSLDGPLITHNILVGKAGDADEFVAGVIMEELESQVPLTQIVRQHAGAKSIEAFVDHMITVRRITPRMQLHRDIAHSKSDLTADDLKGLVSSGLPALKSKTDAIAANMKNAKGYPDDLDASLHKRLYLLTGDDNQRRRAEHERFALITGMRRDTSMVVDANPETYPTLRLGTVLRCAGEYWICITPVCDCVRIDDAGGSFLLAQLIVSDKDWNVIVQADGKYVKLRVDRKRQLIKSVTFGPATSGLVRPVVENKKAIFREPAGNQAPSSYEWLGEMKPMQAQRIVQNFAYNIARIGLDEFEWQRRQAPPA